MLHHRVLVEEILSLTSNTLCTGANFLSSVLYPRGLPWQPLLPSSLSSLSLLSSPILGMILTSIDMIIIPTLVSITSPCVHRVFTMSTALLSTIHYPLSSPKLSSMSIDMIIIPTLVSITSPCVHHVFTMYTALLSTIHYPLSSPKLSSPTLGMITISR